MSEDDASDAEKHQADALISIVQPLRKQLKKHTGKLDKLDTLIKTLKEERVASDDKREALGKQLVDIVAAAAILKGTLDAAPWRSDGERALGELRAAEKRLTATLDEQRVQLAAHAQIFQSTQSTVSALSQGQAALQAEHGDGSKRAADELRGLSARLDHMRGEFAERVTHTFSDSTAHADRLTQRLQQDVLRLEQDVSARAPANALSDASASLHSELHELRAGSDELRRELRASNAQLQELKDAQQSYVLKTAVAGSAATSDTRVAALEETVARLSTAMKEMAGAANDSRLSQRLGLIESRQVRLERDMKHLELHFNGVNEQLALRPLKTDVITAIAQQELAVEACASREAVEKLESLVVASAPAASLAALEETVRISSTQLATVDATLSNLKDGAATKVMLQQRGKEIEALRARLDEKLGRDEGVGMLSSKLDKTEAKSFVQQLVVQQQQQQFQQQFQAPAAGLPDKAPAGHALPEKAPAGSLPDTLQPLQETPVTGHARRFQDTLSGATNQAVEANRAVKQLSIQIERLESATQEADMRLTARRNEVVSLTKVVRLILDDAEMRCAIDEAEGATAAEATDVLSRIRGAGGRGGGGAPMSITGVTLHKPAGGPLQPMPPGAAGADKVWYKQALLPREEVLGQRRRLLVNARHSWVGDACLARAEDAPGVGHIPHPPAYPRDSPDYHQRAAASTGGSGGYGCVLQATPSSTSASPGAGPEPPA